MGKPLQADPAAHGLGLTRGTWGVYLRRLADLLVAAVRRIPRKATVAGAWAALLRRHPCDRPAHGCAVVDRRTGEGRPVCGRRTSRQPGSPTEWRRCRASSGKRFGRPACSSTQCGIEGVVPAHLLPAGPTGIVRQSRRSPHVPRRCSPNASVAPVEQAWIDLFAAMRRAGVSEDDLHPVYAVRSEAIGRGLPPRHRPGLDRAVARGERHSESRQVRLRGATARQDARAPRIGRPPAGLPDRRAGGPSSFGRRAAGTHRRRAGCPAEGAGGGPVHQTSGIDRGPRPGRCAPRRSASSATTSLVQLLRADTAGLDWGRNANQAPTHEKVLRRLREFHDLPWTPAWRRLQAAVVAAGVSMRDNPIPALLRRAAGLDPLELDLAWAWAVDRSLRRAGRADLALTFARDLGRLDALHARAELARSDLLPPPFGPIREKPAVADGSDGPPRAGSRGRSLDGARGGGARHRPQGGRPVHDRAAREGRGSAAAGSRPQPGSRRCCRSSPPAGEGDAQRLLPPGRATGRSPSPEQAPAGGTHGRRPSECTQAPRLIPIRLAA